MDIQKIKRLGTMYRAIENVLLEIKNESLRDTQDIIGQQILTEIEFDPEEKIIRIDSRIRRFPIEPKFTIGNYIVFVDPAGVQQGIVSGMVYRHRGRGNHEGWVYIVNLDERSADNSVWINEGAIKKSLNPWDSPENKGLHGKSMVTLQRFLSDFEAKHGSFLPFEEEFEEKEEEEFKE